MTDAANVLSILDYVTAAGEPVSGGSIEFYQAGTSTARTVYSDAALTVSLGTIVYTDSEGFPVSTQGGSTRVSIYTGTAAYKVVVKNSSGTTLFTRDNIPGALDTSGFTTTSALPTVPVSAKTAAYTITTSDRGYLFNCNPTGGTFVMTLPSAVTAGDNFTIGIRHNGTANQVTIATVSSQYIRGPGTPTSYFSLVGRGEEVWLTSDGADWIVTSYTPALIRPGLLPPPLHVTDRLTAAPSSPTAGARYIVNGTPTGTWSTLGFAEHDIAEADGNGSWIKYTPADGWVAYVADETLLTQYRTSAWTDLSNITAPTTSALKIAVWADEKATNTSGGTSVDDAWTTHTLNTERSNTITGASLASNQFTLPTGKYRVDAQMAAYAMSDTQCRIYSVTNSAVKASSVQVFTANFTSAGASILSGAPVIVTAYIDVTAATETFAFQYYATIGGVASALGRVRNIGSEVEVYALLTVLDLTSVQGPIGTQGVQGDSGLDAAYPYQWSTSTSGDPGSGKISGNNATIASITQLQISETDSAGGSMAAVIATWDDSTSSNRATIKISKEGATQNFHSFRITGAGTDAGTYWTFPVTYIATSGTISNADSCAVLVIEKGDKGDTGATGSAGVYSFDYTFSTTTTSGPSTGTIRANHATLSSATALYIHETDRLGVSQAAAIAQWDDSTTTVKGYLTLVDLTTPANRVRFSITGANVDNGSDDTITVTYVSGVTSLTAVNVAILFERVGDKGADGAGSGDFVGPASSTDNAVVRFDGTTGKLGQNSGVIIDDSNNVTGVASVAVGDGSVSTPAITNTGDTDTGFYFSAADTVDLATAGVRRLEASATGTFGFNVAAQAASASVVRIDEPSGNTTNDTRVTIANSAGNRAALTQSNASDHITLAMGASAVSTLGNRWGLGMSGSGEYAISVEHGGYPSTYHKNVGVHVNATTAINPLSIGETEATTTSGQMVGIYKAGATYATLRNTTANIETIIGATASAGIFGTASAHAILFYVANSALLQFDGSALSPVSSGTVALGTSSLGYSNLFLHTGAVFNWGAGNVMLTHSAATLTLAGATSLAMGTSIAVGLGTIELGHASDTTLSRSSAGVLAVEGVTVALNSTSAAAHVASTIELGHASDTTISRSAAGVIAVEGVPLYSNIPQNSQSAAYTTVLADAQKHILHPSADTTARTFTIDSNANVAYPIGTAITFVNQASAGVVTIAITSDTMRLAGAGTTGSRSLAANGIATALKITSTEWIISGTGLT